MRLFLVHFDPVHYRFPSRYCSLLRFCDVLVGLINRFTPPPWLVTRLAPLQTAQLAHPLTAQPHLPWPQLPGQSSSLHPVIGLTTWNGRVRVS